MSKFKEGDVVKVCTKDTALLYGHAILDYLDEDYVIQTVLYDVVYLKNKNGVWLNGDEWFVDKKAVRKVNVSIVSTLCDVLGVDDVQNN